MKNFKVYSLSVISNPEQIIVVTVRLNISARKIMLLYNFGAGLLFVSK